MKRKEMTAAAKFRATCATCGQQQPRATTAWTVRSWMSRHETWHHIPMSAPTPESKDAADE